MASRCVKTMYKVSWDNDHAAGTFPMTFSSKRDALAFAREWKRDMVAADSDPAEARRVYQWEIDEVEAPVCTPKRKK